MSLGVGNPRNSQCGIANLTCRPFWTPASEMCAMVKHIVRRPMHDQLLSFLFKL